MARGDHPARTPLYGGIVILAAMMAGLAVTAWSTPPAAVRAVVLVIALLAALAGFVMTLRDNADFSNPPDRHR
jgi:UDP-N-acetylmuramyl pentapeptide phosphotransferase/UDP-N-acetylglucosamine-1-phosphate transferase